MDELYLVVKFLCAVDNQGKGTGIKLLHKCKEGLTDYECDIWTVGALVFEKRR